MDQKIDANYPIARTLVEKFPEKAIELIVSTCEYQQISTAIKVAGHARNLNSHIVNPRNEYSALEAPFPSASSTTSQHSASPKPPPITPRYPRSRANTAALPPSPAPTSSTGQSSNRPDYVHVPVGGNKECQLSMRKVPTEHSVIRQSIVERRLKDHFQVEQIPHGPIQLPFQGRILTSCFQTELTWRRDPSWNTHVATFYLVQEDIDSDILLGEADSGEGLTTTMGAQSQGHHGTTITGQPEMSFPYPQRFYPQMRPPAPGVPFPTESFHRSSHMDGSFHRSSHMDESVSALYQGPNRGQPFNGPNAHLGDMSHPRGQALSGHDSPLSQVHEQGSAPEEVRVDCTWDKTCSSLKLDLNAPAENFLLTIDKKFKRYNKVLGRDDTHSLRFTAEKGSDECYDLSLSESDLIDDWTSAMGWIRDNRGTNKSRIFVVIEMNEVDGG